ncbi:DUF169 domain-containing protein [Methanolobus bombayensis]|uniref:DUF169 domain-containing protein n=1 Tax=Methanolobus bombayensis TaxID=38023 RepID=UPI001FD75C23|nr:DUF169 domain-containing protein [Methanolobus bombayensis]MBP1910685.1 uncharacterized protein (DUF169 family) [Methanolobus bombayensis]
MNPCIDSNCQNYPNIEALMDKGEPVCISLCKEEAETSEMLFCELVHMARNGESFLIEDQRCRPGKFILGISENSPAEYYLKSNRYQNEEMAQKAVDSLPRIEREYGSLKIEPMRKNNGKFDVLLLYLKPESAMKIIQAYAFNFGEGITSRSIGAASICGDCTARPLKEGIGISYGCKGSRKHSDYTNDEVPIGIAYNMLQKIEEGLKKIPATFD